MKLNKEDLKYGKYYDWQDDNIFENRLPDMQEAFIKYDGYYTLALINLFAEKHQIDKLEELNKLEDAIGVCPEKYKIFEEVIYWLELDLSFVSAINRYRNRN